MSTNFIDGPARGATLNLARAPLMLRVVIAPGGAVDALDQPSDIAQPDERVVVYIMRGRTTTAFTDARTPSGKRAGWREEFATYRLYPEPVADEDARDNARWSAWCHANETKLRQMWAADFEASGGGR